MGFLSRLFVLIVLILILSSLIYAASTAGEEQNEVLEQKQEKNEESKPVVKKERKVIKKGKKKTVVNVEERELKQLEILEEEDKNDGLHILYNTIVSLELDNSLVCSLIGINKEPDKNNYYTYQKILHDALKKQIKHVVSRNKRKIARAQLGSWTIPFNIFQLIWKNKKLLANNSINRQKFNQELQNSMIEHLRDLIYERKNDAALAHKDKDDDGSTKKNDTKLKNKNAIKKKNDDDNENDDRHAQKTKNYDNRSTKRNDAGNESKKKNDGGHGQKMMMEARKKTEK